MSYAEDAPVGIRLKWPKAPQVGDDGYAAPGVKGTVFGHTAGGPLASRALVKFDYKSPSGGIWTSPPIEVVRGQSCEEDIEPNPREIRVLDHGYVALVDTMGTDRTPARTARTSFRNKKERTAEEDARLTSYLIKHRHNTPLEFCQLLFYVKLPIFVARQFVRHRMQSINEVSYRYVQAAREYYVPSADRMQRAPDKGQNKQGSSEELVERPDLCADIMREAGEFAFNRYEELLADGLAPELARTVLPVSTYTEWYCQWDLHNFLHMIGLRIDPHAQYEIRVYAQAMLDLARTAFPGTIGAWQALRQG